MLHEDIHMGKEYMTRHFSGSPSVQDASRVRVIDNSTLARIILCQILDKKTGKPTWAKEWIEPWRFMREWVED